MFSSLDPTNKFLDLFRREFEWRSGNFEILLVTGRRAERRAIRFSQIWNAHVPNMGHAFSKYGTTFQIRVTRYVYVNFAFKQRLLVEQKTRNNQAYLFRKMVKGMDSVFWVCKIRPRRTRRKMMSKQTFSRFNVMNTWKTNIRTDFFASSRDHGKIESVWKKSWIISSKFIYYFFFLKWVKNDSTFDPYSFEVI